MLRFLSRKRGRTDPKARNIKAGAERLNPPNKHCMQCRVMLLDGTDLCIELSVSTHKKSIVLHLCRYINFY